jgi:hypothetical protein
MSQLPPGTVQCPSPSQSCHKRCQDMHIVIFCFNFHSVGIDYFKSPPSSVWLAVNFNSRIILILVALICNAQTAGLCNTFCFSYPVREPAL